MEEGKKKKKTKKSSKEKEKVDQTEPPKKKKKKKKKPLQDEAPAKTVEHDECKRVAKNADTTTTTEKKKKKQEKDDNRGVVVVAKNNEQKKAVCNSDNNNTTTTTNNNNSDNYYQKKSDDDDDDKIDKKKNKKAVSKWAEREAFFFNHGSNIAVTAIYLSLNVGMAVWGIWEFTVPHWSTASDILRITLPIARAGGRLVTFNAAILLITASKYFWTLIREHTVIPLGFPVDNVMPLYHRYVAWLIIVNGCIIHTIPQIINYATQAIPIVDGKPIWTFGDGMSTKQLLITGILLNIIFTLFFVTTMERVRHTALGFRIFWITHLVGIITAFPLLIIHGTARGEPIALYFLAGPLLLYTVDVVKRKLVTITRQATISTWSCHDDQGEKVVKLSLLCPEFDYKPGQYAELFIPQISFYEWHPFTIASAPSFSKDAKSQDTIAFYIKASGRWTNQLYDLVAASPNGPHEIVPSVGLRGPHGAPAQNYLAYRHLLVIGSGIGVTPLLSVWQYLTHAGSDLICEPSPKDDNNSKKKGKQLEQENEQQLLNRLGAFLDSVDVVTLEQNKLETFRGHCAYYASVMETMTVNICLFCASVFMETIVFSVWIYNLNVEAAILQLLISVIALAVFGFKILFSVLAYGPARYFTSWVAFLEMGIVFLDLVAVITSIGTIHSHSKEEAILYFTFFSAFIVLHACRIFHIFHATARPPPLLLGGEGENAGNMMSLLDPHHKVESLCNITGIWISKYFSSMSFAAADLMETLPGLPPVFNLELYGTREKDNDIDTKVEWSRTSSLSNNKHTFAGRPDWESICLRAIDKAHNTNPEGESVGIFFCGAPAIARVLQRTAQQITAQHQHATVKLDGQRCQCRILVHKENF